MIDKLTCANCATIGRREFVSASFMAAAAAALAACSGATATTSPSNVSATIRISDYAALANVGGVATLSAGGTPIAVVRTGTTSFVALSRVCPHQGSTVNVVNGGFLCPNHGAQFNSVGTWQGGQRTSNMRSYATQYDATAGTLTIG